MACPAWSSASSSTSPGASASRHPRARRNPDHLRRPGRAASGSYSTRGRQWGRIQSDDPHQMIAHNRSVVRIRGRELECPIGLDRRRRGWTVIPLRLIRKENHGPEADRLPLQSDSAGNATQLEPVIRPAAEKGKGEDRQGITTSNLEVHAHFQSASKEGHLSRHAQTRPWKRS